MEKQQVLLSLGSNLGSKRENIAKAISLLIEKKILVNVKVSSFYETEPVGFKDQPQFINAAITGETLLNPKELLLKCKEIEREIGRKPRPRWHEREIDLDIILYGNKILKTNTLQIPHPEMANRRFVLVPASEIASDWQVPGIHKTINEVLENCEDKSKVVQIAEN
jgi:2-amino-4-hydroxy-6-hydroxymethyldihydropteridine diphosphokinase